MTGLSRDVESVYELSPLQEGLLVESLANPDAGLYVEQVMLELAGALSPSALARSWRIVVGRHPALRTSFHWEGLERPVQVVHRGVTVPIAHNDLRSVPPARRDAALGWFLQEDRARGFRFDRAPLLRVTMLQHGAAAHRVVVTMHHILLDGWSVGIVMDEVGAVYRSLVDGVPWRLEEARPYGDYIAWLREQDHGAAEQRWRRSLAGFEEAPPLSLLGGATAARFGGARFGEHERAVDPATAAKIGSLARKLRITQNVAVLGAWSIVLGAELRTDDLVVGAVVSGRDGPLERIDTVVGLCINTVPVRIRIDPRVAVQDWLAELHAEQLELREHQHCPLTEVHGWSSVPRGRPLFESIFIFENHATLQGPQNGARSTGRAFERTNYPLTVLVGVVPGLSLKILYDASVVGREAVERLAERFVDVLGRIGRDPSATVGSLSAATPTEALRALELGEGPAVAVGETPVHGLVAARARARPDATALVDQGRRVSFGELDRDSDALARRLRQLGLGEGAVAGVYLERSVGLVVAVLAALKAGAAFLPLEPAAPPERLRFMLVDSGAAVVVTSEHLRGDLPESAAAVVCIDERAHHGGPPLPPVSLDAPAWLLYTSGSTGLPKGVLGSHRGLVNRIEWGLRAEPFDADEVCVLTTRLAFVDSLWELFGPLAAGVRLVVGRDADLRDPRALAALLRREGATRLVTVPSLLAALLDAAPDELSRSRLRRLTLSGEPLSASLARRTRALLPDCTLRNLYGSTEVTADATWHELADRDDERIPIGRPIANARVRVLDPRGEIVPVGAVGEIHVGGAGLALGYVGQAAAAAGGGRFVDDPLLPGERLYRTGDLGRWRADEELDFAGRADRQLKIRGVRVEPGELERVLCELDDVHEAAAVPRAGADGAELVAFVVATDASADALRSFLRDRLPEQLVPSRLFALEALPRLPSGKVDRAALAELARLRAAETAAEGPPPRTTAERLVAEAFVETLGVHEPGAQDDFFALGGHSLLATRLASALSARFELAIPLAWIFEHPVVAELAGTIEDALVADIRGQRERSSPAGAAEAASAP